MKYKFIDKLPKDVEFLKTDAIGRELYKKGNFGYIKYKNGIIERIKL